MALSWQTALNGFAISLDYGKFPDRKYDSKAVWGDSEKINRILEKRGTCAEAAQ